MNLNYYELQRIIEKEIAADSSVKIIVFNQYRENGLDIEEKLNKIEGIKAKVFVISACYVVAIYFIFSSPIIFKITIIF